MKKQTFNLLMVKNLAVALMSLFWLCLNNAQAELHPKIEEALNRESRVGGFIFDIQSKDPNYYAKNLSYLKEQLEAIYDYSEKYQLIVLSRGREMQSFLTINSQKTEFQVFKFFHDRYGLKIKVDIEIAVSLGYNENAFPNIVNVMNGTYITIVSGRENNMRLIELERMSLQEKAQIKLSPTWRIDRLR